MCQGRVRRRLHSPNHRQENELKRLSAALKHHSTRLSRESATRPPVGLPLVLGAERTITPNKEPQEAQSCKAKRSSTKVLKMLQEEGREYLFQEDVLEQAWVGLKRPKRASSEAVAVAVIACVSPTRKAKTFRQKSVTGRKITALPDSVVVVHDKKGGGLPGQSFVSRRGGTKFARHSSASIRQRVVARGIGVSRQSAVACDSHLGDGVLRAHEPGATLVFAARQKQALLHSDNNSERGEGVLEERQWGTAPKMAAPTAEHRDEIIVLFDCKEEEHTGKGCFISGIELVNVPVLRQDGGRMQLVPRLFSPILHKVQEWDVNNQTIYQTGQHIEVAEKGGVGMRGKLYGEADVSGKAGRAQVRLDFWQLGSSVQWPGCGGTYALGGHEEHTASAGSGRPAYNEGTSVGVSTPSRHRNEERARSRAARLTSGETILPVMQDVQHLVHDEPSTSWRAGGMDRSVVMEEELLDYDDGNASEVVDLVQHKRTEKRLVQNKSNKGRSLGVLQETATRAVRSDHHGGGSWIILSAGSLPQGEERREGMVLSGRVSQTGSVVLAAKALVKDMGVQAGIVDKDDSLNKDLTIEVSGMDMGSAMAYNAKEDEYLQELPEVPYEHQMEKRFEQQGYMNDLGDSRKDSSASMPLGQLAVVVKSFLGKVFTVDELTMSEELVRQVLSLLEEASRLDLLAPAAHPHVRPVRRAAAGVAAAVLACSPPRGYADTSGEQVMADTIQSSRGLQTAQDPRGEEKAEPRAAGWIYEGSEGSAGFHGCDVGGVQWDGRSGARAGISRHQQTTGMVARWESGFPAAPRRPSVATQHTQSETYTYLEEQPGPSGVAPQVFSGRTVLDFDRESLEEGEVQEVYGAQKREVNGGRGTRSKRRG
ncbi:hypothetical protein NDU88_004495 [Pleurodeles waltl]|uniref:Uncharacterized protein n=1 Tax=Pleurodeles waltl TaxID=8319 RepID=A0AAV7MA30_PLEWA|nr:hypothetical protein NDU88_004495 [Pleurodeles waltl]